jgi:formate dehydrogenase major subunit
MIAGETEGFFVMGENPAVGGGNGRMNVMALASLKWLVVRDLVEVETASF